MRLPITDANVLEWARDIISSGDFVVCPYCDVSLDRQDHAVDCPVVLWLTWTDPKEVESRLNRTVHLDPQPYPQGDHDPMT